MTDREWLEQTLQKIGNRATASLVEQFTERVGILMADGHSEHEARWLAYRRYCL